MSDTDWNIYKRRERSCLIADEDDGMRRKEILNCIYEAERKKERPRIGERQDCAGMHGMLEAEIE
jgi:hypothetical protein